MHSMNCGEISRLRRGFANSTSGEQAPRPPSCECEVDSMSKLIEPRLIKLHNYDARCCIIIMERYRSGHNGADSKSVCAQAHEGSNPSLSAKSRKHPQRGCFLLFGENIIGIRTQWSKQHGVLFGNGDRRFLRSVSKEIIRDGEQKSRCLDFFD